MLPLLTVFDAIDNGMEKVKIDDVNLPYNLFGTWQIVSGNAITCAEVAGDVADAVAKYTWATAISSAFSNDCFADAPAPTTYVPDDAFEQYLINIGSDDNLDDHVDTAALKALTTINLYGLGTVASMEGLEACINLKSLYVGGNNLTSIDVSANTKLTCFRCQENSITKLDISMLPLLTVFDAIDNGMEKIKIDDVNLPYNLFGTWSIVSGNNITCAEVAGDVADAVAKYTWATAISDAFSNDCFESSLAVETLDKESYSIYPNPFSEILTIKSNDVIEVIVITNLQGKEILRTNGQTKELDLSHLSSGMYLLQMFSGEGVTVEKIIKR
jgi:Leucine-rich repeat (LRR) protein